MVNIYEGALLLLSGQLARSIDILERTLSVARGQEIEYHIPSIACVLGRAYVDTGRYTDARRLLESASAFADRSRHVGKRLLCSPPLVRALAEGPDCDLAAAKDLAMLTLREATAHGFRPVMVYTQLALARVLKLIGEPKRAQIELRKAIALSKTLGLVREELGSTRKPWFVAVLSPVGHRRCRLKPGVPACPSQLPGVGVVTPSTVEPPSPSGNMRGN